LAKSAVVPFLESAISHYAAQLQKVGEAKDAEIKELKAQLEGLVGATPSLGKATETDSNEEDENPDSLMNFGKSIFR
jgi:cell division septum initiation protein DivIVA